MQKILQNFAKNLTKNFQKITIFELVLILVLSVAIGVAFWGWTFVYDAFKPILKVSGLNYLVAGFWIFASVVLSYIVQKPLVAIIASLMAAFVQSMLTHWGPMSLLWGFVQGAGAELVFFLFAYRKWNSLTVILAAIASCTCSYLLDYYFYGYYNLKLSFNILQLSTYIISAIIFAGVLSLTTVKRLKKLGLLDQFKIAKK